jgi:hypothetical protein
MALGSSRRSGKFCFSTMMEKSMSGMNLSGPEMPYILVPANRQSGMSSLQQFGNYS